MIVNIPSTVELELFFLSRGRCAYSQKSKTDGPNKLGSRDGESRHILPSLARYPGEGFMGMNKAGDSGPEVSSIRCVIETRASRHDQWDTANFFSAVEMYILFSQHKPPRPSTKVSAILEPTTATTTTT